MLLFREPSSKCVVMNTQGLFNLKPGPTEIAEYSGRFFAMFIRVEVAARTILHLVVFLASHYFKVARVIVDAIAVGVVNNLIRFKRSAQHFLSNYAMLVKIFFTVFTDNAVTITSNVTTLPIPMVWAVKALNRPFGNRRISQLFKAGSTKRLISQFFVFGGSHFVFDSKMGRADLHTANQPAQLALDGIF